MVAMLEIAFLIICAVLGVWWLRRTKLYRVRRGDPNYRNDKPNDQYFDNNSAGG